MLDTLNTLVAYVKENVSNYTVVEQIDTIDTWSYNVNTEALTNLEMVAYNELQNQLWKYYSC
jgi:hypothetical protein